ncbi:Endosulfine-domain-containing protein [Paraphaeosphaeria sporulosa]|uniref:mRNA stability protein n=1 Tax=Paraphaeosphaeria sporulosa TaxID=1460663 RepID=A0A177CJZ8_9PLEO|nr:Endosulfine-domain-containing protein [Paraphaeosphaeria sporulosa]OAG07160.1 Endosulfine-domain-containing protein [Paraphaeosphaeria sporulosa]
MASNIATQKLSPDEARLFRLYGKLPNKKDLLQNKLKERKYFDSGDYALSKAGKASDIGVTSIGREHPVPEKIPHIAPPAHNSQNGQTQTQNGQEKGHTSGSPVKENTFLHRETSLNRETSAEDFERGDDKEDAAQA